MFSRCRKWLAALASGAPRMQAPVIAGRDQHWDATVDVAVVGFGGAGAAAALEAREQGASVAVIDRFNGGGSTVISGGIYYAGGGTLTQQQAGIDDSVQNMFNYLRRETGDAVAPDTLRRFCEQSPANLDWLRGQGVPFEGSLCPYKTSYPPNDYYLYYSGNEAFAPYTDDASPAARGHRAHGRGVSGAAFFKPLLKRIRDRGVTLLTQHRAVALICSENGAVLGVQLLRMQPGSVAAWLHRQLYALLIFCRYAAMYVPLLNWIIRGCLQSLESRCGRPYALRARTGVVISAGGFFYNREMLRQYSPNNMAGMPLGTIGDDGSGILLGEAVGARLRSMGNVSQWRFVNPPESLVRGVLVDRHGKRICNEMLYGAQVGQRIMEAADGAAWLIIDSRLKKQALREIGPKRAMWFQSATALVYLFLARRKAATLRQLAASLDMPYQALAATIDEYNRLQEHGEQDPLGKPDSHRCTLEQAPWYALDCRVDGAVANPSITLGGLQVDEDSGQVLAGDGTAIAGLYAAGRSAVGIASNSYVSGLSIADCIFSGRRAGRHAAANSSTACAGQQHRAQ